MSQGVPHDPYRTVAQLVPGQRFLQRYTLTRILGRGGFGVVWLAHDDELQMDVAIKFLSELIVNNPEAVDDLKRETRYSLRLTHPNIVRIYGFLQGPDMAGVSMEYVDGGTLSALKVERPNRCFDVDDLAPLVAKLCDALQYAHTRVKVAHRDLKPGNLMVDSSGDLKVADFGISRSISDTQTALTQAAASGTPAYMSPQQMMGERSQVTDDIYSLGATLYDLLAGKPPFYQGNVVEQVRESKPVSIAARRADLGISGAPVPPEWEAVIAACLEKRAEDRPQSAAEVAERLGLPIHAQWREATPLGTPREPGDPGYSTPTSRATPPDNRLLTPPPESSRAGFGSVGEGAAQGRSAGELSDGGGAGAAARSGAGAARRSGSGARNAGIAIAVVAVLVAGFFGWKSFSGQDAPGSRDVARRADSATDDASQRSSRESTQSDRASGSADRSATGGGSGSDSRVDGGADPPAGVSNAANEGNSGADGSNPGADGRTSSPSDGNSIPPTGSTPMDPGAATAQAGAAQSQSSGQTQTHATQTPGTQPKGPTEVELARAVESAIDRRDWEGADRQLALLQATYPGAGAAAFARRIEEGRRAAVAESRIPALIESGDLALAETELGAYASIRPDDPRTARWRTQIEEMKAAREGPARERREIGLLVMEFHDSFSDLDLDRFSALFVDPGATRSEYERAFRDLASQTITILSEPNIDLHGDAATVHLRDRRRQVMKIGRTFESEFDVVLQLQKMGDRWKIRTAQTKVRQ